MLVTLSLLLATPARADELPTNRPPTNAPSPPTNAPSGQFVTGVLVATVGGSAMLWGFGNAALDLALDGDCVSGERLPLSIEPCRGPEQPPSLGALLAVGTGGLIVAGVGVLLIALDVGTSPPNPGRPALGRDGVFRF